MAFSTQSNQLPKIQEAPRITMNYNLNFFLAIALLVLFGCQDRNINDEWRVYKSDAASSSYSALDQINTDNVNQLKVAWTYQTGDPGSTIRTNPIIVDDVLYGVSPHLNVFAIDATTGTEQWMFEPFEEENARGRQRGLVYWEDEAGEDRRIFFSSGNWLYALDANTGSLLTDFGDEGRVDLNVGLRRDPDSISVKASSPGIIYQDLLIIGSSVGEGRNAPPGDIRAYDVRTGEIAWTFHTIPKPGEPGADTWHISDESLRQQGGANNWAGMSLDRERGIVYVPTGSPVYDFYGGNRPGKNLYGNSLLALDAATGERVWHFQAVHHDLWDYDLPAPPNLVTVERNGEEIDAVAQVTKQGFTFVLDRATGEPVFPIEEQPVPDSRIEGEQAWPTQPVPTKPEPFARQHLTKDEVTNVSPDARDAVLTELATHRNEGLFTPPDPAGTIVLPSTRGAANWGGAAFDPESGILYVGASELVGLSTVVKIGGSPSPDESLFARGRNFYVQNCAACHGMDKQGQPPTYPSLANVQDRLSTEEILTTIRQGGSQMPAFPSITEKEKKALMTFLSKEEQPADPGHGAEEENVGSAGGLYVDTTSYGLFQDPNGYPAIKPPWGTLNAINLNTGEIVWKVPLGTHSTPSENMPPEAGTPTRGGAIVTGGGLVFIGATEDQKFRAFDKTTGEVLWEASLPAAGFATPATYVSDGRQYVVIAAGGGRGTETEDSYVAFALPE